MKRLIFCIVLMMLGSSNANAMFRNVKWKNIARCAAFAPLVGIDPVTAGVCGYLSERDSYIREQERRQEELKKALAENHAKLAAVGRERADDAARLLNEQHGRENAETSVRKIGQLYHRFVQKLLTSADAAAAEACFEEFRADLQNIVDSYS